MRFTKLQLASLLYACAHVYLYLPQRKNRLKSKYSKPDIVIVIANGTDQNLYYTQHMDM